jgi:GntR family transcriptional regulator
LDTFTGKIALNFRSAEPLYLQIAQQIGQMVARGDLKVGDQLPTVREMATDLRINFNTVARAYRVLDEQRLISTQRGRGTYIWEEPTLEALNELRQRGLEEMVRQLIQEAARLGFDRQQVQKVFNEQVTAWREEIPDQDEKITQL